MTRVPTHKTKHQQLSLRCIFLQVCALAVAPCFQEVHTSQLPATVNNIIEVLTNLKCFKKYQEGRWDLLFTCFTCTHIEKWTDTLKPTPVEKRIFPDNVVHLSSSRLALCLIGVGGRGRQRLLLIIQKADQVWCYYDSCVMGVAMWSVCVSLFDVVLHGAPILQKCSVTRRLKTLRFLNV